VWKDDYSANKLLRKKFREEKKNIADIKIADDEIRKKGSLDIDLVPEQPEDVERAKKIKFYNAGT
jgi:coiled-coil domain-containing protein 130